MEVVHAFGNLLAKAENCARIVVSRGDVYLLVQTSVAPVGDDGELRLRDYAEQAKDVRMAKRL